MSTYFRLLKYVVPFWRKVVLLLVTVTLFASLSGVSLTLIHPFLRIVLYDRNAEAQIEAQAGVEADKGTQGIPLPENIDRARVSLQTWFEDRMYAGDAKARLLRFCLILLGLFFIKNLFGFFDTFLTVYLEQKILYRIRFDAYAHIQNLPLGFFQRERTGHIISRLTNDVSMLRGAVIGVAASLVRNGLMTLIALVVVLAVSWKLSLLTFVVIPVNLVLIGVIGRRLKRRSFRAQEGMAEMTSLLEESLSGMRVVKAFNMGEYEKRRFDKFNLSYIRHFLKMKLWGAAASPTSELLGTFSIVAILWYGGNLVQSGAISPENLVLFVGAMIWVVAPVKSISKLNAPIQEGIACANRVFSLLEVEPEPLEQSRGMKQAEFKKSICFDSVSFEYVPGHPVLDNVSLVAEPGEVIALVGPSGAGKTTLVDLIPRFYNPQSGAILFDDVDIREVDLGSLRDMMGIVTQEVILFNDTVRNNISYGKQDCSLDDIIRAAQAANAHDFITQLPKGYDTVIGERGTQLSGGQRQRISIARAILKDPQVLIFDEATSALDTESEILVQGAIDRLLKGRTTFVIAHRLSTIQNADKILVIDEGKVCEFGTHESLIKKDGVYRKLYNLQFGLTASLNQ